MCNDRNTHSRKFMSLPLVDDNNVHYSHEGFLSERNNIGAISAYFCNNSLQSHLRTYCCAKIKNVMSVINHFFYPEI